jgi:dimethylglycine dehydrogenase
MKSHARVVVIGGGVAGCSTLYHLAKEGWSDVVLVERDELTSGSTWHAAAQVTQFGANQTMIGLKRHSINLYRELAADPDFPINYHITGGMRLGYTQEHEDTYNHYIGMAKAMGVEFELIDGQEAGRRHALMEPDGVRCAWWDPLDGDIDPSQLTQALARAARKMGAEVYRFNPVENITCKENGEWIVHTKNGDITCESVVNATGYRVNEVGSMLGVEHPVTSMEHMYFLTDPIPELEAMEERVPIIRDPGDDFYSRQEKNGLLVGIYEQSCKDWGMDGIDPDFTMALLPNDLDRCLDNMERIFERMPSLTRTGIHTVVNGPITYSPDGTPLIGRIPGLENAYCAIGLRAGIGEGGGHGKMLAQTIIYGQAEWDTWCLDPRRFSRYTNTEFTRLKAIEDYQLEFHYHLPHESRPAGRLARTTPLYPVLKEQNAEFGTVSGWERVLFFKPDTNFKPDHGFRFGNWHDVVGDEVKALTQNVGLMEVSGFNRFEITGEGAADWLNSLFCGPVPKTVGRVGLAYSLTERGQVLSEATLAKLSDQSFWYGSAAASEFHDMDWLNKHKPDQGIEIRSLTATHTILVLAGPKSRELLSAVSPRTDWSNAAFPWLTCKRVYLGHAEALAMRVSFSGELGWELHIPNEQLYLAHQILSEAGKQFNLSLFGLLATESMRLEKGYKHWKADLVDEYTPFETGLDRFVRLNKPEFVGKAALTELSRTEPRRKFVTMIIETDHAPAHGGDSIYDGEKIVGTVSSGGWGYRVQKNIAMGFVDADFSNGGQKLEIGLLGQRIESQVVANCLFDPENSLVKG